MADALELRLILWVGLDAETSREDELADGSAKAGKEGVEGLYYENGVSASPKDCGDHGGGKKKKTFKISISLIRIPPAALSLSSKTPPPTLQTGQREKSNTENLHNCPQAHSKQTAKPQPRPKMP